MKLTRLFSILFIIGLTISGANVFAQQDPSAPTRLALEVTFYPGRKPAYETVPGPDSKPSGAWFGLFAHIASWQAPAGAPPVEAVRVISRAEGDAVRVTVSTLSGSKALENEQRVGTYLIRETKKISIDELRLVGIEPFEIKLVRVNPSIAPVPPVILKGVESVVVINAMAKETTLPSYRIILRNQSNKNIVALGVEGYFAGEKMELPRLIPLLENALNSSNADLTEGLRNLESQISSVLSDADPQTVRSLTSEFPQAGGSITREIKETMEVTATTIKSNLLKDIHMLQNQGSQSLNADLYRTWLTKTKERYEKWLSRLQ